MSNVGEIVCTAVFNDYHHLIQRILLGVIQAIPYPRFLSLETDFVLAGGHGARCAGFPVTIVLVPGKSLSCEQHPQAVFSPLARKSRPAKPFSAVGPSCVVSQPGPALPQ
ncbi:MAG TPA: hypothetical protein VGZ22_06540 [Isosphaeraceae bacterium]|nr:hypothetical protein [Isosphaeraceae bacterium]